MGSGGQQLNGSAGQVKPQGTPAQEWQLRQELQAAQAKLAAWNSWYNATTQQLGSAVGAKQAADEPFDKFVADVRKARKERIKKMVVLPLKCLAPVVVFTAALLLFAEFNYAQYPNQLYTVWGVDAVIVLFGGTLLGLVLDAVWEIK